MKSPNISTNTIDQPIHPGTATSTQTYIISINEPKDGEAAPSVLLENLPPLPENSIIVFRDAISTQQEAFEQLLGHFSPKSIIEASDGMYLQPGYVYIPPMGYNIAVANQRVWLQNPAMSIATNKTLEAPNLKIKQLTEKIEDKFCRQNEAQNYTPELEGQFQELQALNADLSHSVQKLKHTNETLENAEKKYEALVSNITDIVTLVDENGIIMYDSPSVTRLLGYEIHEQIGHNVMDYVHPDDLGLVMSKFAEGLMASGEGPVVVYRYRTKNGDYRFLESQGNNQLSNAYVKGIIITSKDVTEKIEAEKRIAESHQRLLQAFANLPFGFIVHTIEGEIKEINTAAQKILGFEQHEKKINEIDIPKDIFPSRAVYEKIIDRLLKEETINGFRISVKHSRGHEMVVEVNLSLVGAGNESPLVQAIFNDITNDYSARRLVDKTIQLKDAFDNHALNELITKGLSLAAELLVSKSAYLTKVNKENKDFELMDYVVRNETSAKITLPKSDLIKKYKLYWNRCETNKESLILNNYEVSEGKNSNTDKRQIIIPIIEKNRVVALLGTLGKEYIYTQLDISQLSAFAHQLWTILERKKIEEKSKANNALLTLSQGIAKMGTWQLDLGKSQLNWTKEVYNILGLKPDELQATHTLFLSIVAEEDRRKVEMAHKKAQQTGLTYQIDYRISLSDETEKIIEEHGYAEKDQQGNVIKLFGTIQDITHKKYEEIRRNLLSEITKFFTENEGLNICLQKALKYLCEIGQLQFGEAWLPGQDTSKLYRVSYYSENAKSDLFFEDDINKNLSFHKGEGLPGTTWKKEEIVIWDDVQINQYFYRKEAAKKAGIQSVMGLPLIFNKSVTGVILFGSSSKINQLRYFQRLFSPLSSAIGTEVKRKIQEEEFLQIFNTAPDLICIAGTDGYFKRINKAGIELLGYPEEELLSKPFQNFVHPEDRDITEKESVSVFNGNIAGYFENRYITAKGETVWLAWSSNIISERELIFSVARNITEQKKLQLLLNSIAELANVGGWEINFITKNVFISSGAKKIFGQDPNITTNIKETLKHFSFENAALLKERIIALYRYNIPLEIQIPIQFSDGTEKWVYIKGDAEIMKGKCVRMYGSIQDIHQLKVSEIALRKSYQSIQDYKLALDVSANIVVTDLKGYITDVNERTCHLTGYTREELIGQHTRINKSGMHSREFYSNLWRTISSGEVWRGELYNLKKDGSGYWVDTIIVPLKDEEGTIMQYLAIRNDITDRKNYISEIETQIKRLREIAWMQSHVVRAPLARLMGLVELLKMESITEEDIAEILMNIEKSAKELDTIVREIVDKTRLIDNENLRNI